MLLSMISPFKLFTISIYFLFDFNSNSFRYSGNFSHFRFLQEVFSRVYRHVQCFVSIHFTPVLFVSHLAVFVPSRITHPSPLAQFFLQTLSRSLFPTSCPLASHCHTFLHGLFSYFSQFANSFELRWKEASIRSGIFRIALPTLSSKAGSHKPSCSDLRYLNGV